MIYMRGQAADYDGWRSSGLPVGAGTTCCLTSSARRTTTGAQASFMDRAANGGVERPRVSWPILDAVREAGVEIGIPKIADFNQGDNEGSGYFEVNQRRGAALERGDGVF